MNANNSVTVPDPFIKPLQDADYLIQAISTASGEDEFAVIQQLWQEHHHLGQAVSSELKRLGITRYEWSDELALFYQKSNAFLYETTIWNRSLVKNEMRHWIGHYLAREQAEPQRVLMFGDGMGFDSLYLAQAGHQVDYHDVSSDGASFANRLFRDFNAEITILKDSTELTAEAYDVIICLDVLEHVPDPAQMIGELSQALKADGKFIVHAPFWYIAPTVPTHLRSNMIYSGDLKKLYAPFGLHPVQGRLFHNPVVFQKYAADSQRGSSASQSPAALPFPLWAGSLLLKVARISNWPHRLYFHLMSMMQQRAWTDLEELAKEQSSSLVQATNS